MHVLSFLQEDTITPMPLLHGRGVGRDGLMRRLLQKAPQQPPLAALFEQHPMDAPLVAVSMNHIPTAGPRNRKYLAYWRPVNSSINTSAATFDLNSRQVVSAHVYSCHACTCVVMYEGPSGCGSLTMYVQETYKIF